MTQIPNTTLLVGQIFAGLLVIAAHDIGGLHVCALVDASGATYRYVPGFALTRTSGVQS